MFAKNPREVLSVDFDPDRAAAANKRIIDNSVVLYRAFSTPNGHKAMEVMETMVAGRLVDTNSYQTVANSAIRDFVDTIKLGVLRGEEALKQ